MDREEELRFQFRNTPFAEFYGMELGDLKEGRITIRLPLVPHFLTHHGVVAGAIIFSLANTAGAYAAMMAIRSDEEVVATEILRGRYQEAVLVEDIVIIAEAAIVADNRFTDERGRERREIIVEINVVDGRQKQKATFALTYAVFQGSVLREIIEKRRMGA